MKKLLIGILLLPLLAVGQINDTWDAVKAGTTDMGRIYVGNTLVWQKAIPRPSWVSTSDTYVYDGGLVAQYPSNVSSGDLIIVVVWMDASASVTAPTGFSTYSNLSNFDAARGSGGAFYKFADGTEDGTNIPITVGSSRSEAIVIHISGASSTLYNSWGSLISSTRNLSSGAMPNDRINIYVLHTSENYVNNDQSFTNITGNIDIVSTSGDYFVGSSYGQTYNVITTTGEGSLTWNSNIGSISNWLLVLIATK